MTKKKILKDYTACGRPKFEYNQKMAADICEAIATSTDPLRTILAYDPTWPSEHTIRCWRFSNSAFSGMYVDAKRMQADLFAEEVIEISDNGTNDYYEKNGVPAPDFENIQRSRLRVDSRKWLAGKLANKLYGDKLTTEAHIFNHEQSLKDLA